MKPTVNKRANPKAGKLTISPSAAHLSAFESNSSRKGNNVSVMSQQEDYNNQLLIMAAATLKTEGSLRLGDT